MQSHFSPRTAQNTGTPGEIPDKLYFRIGDVARLCGVEAYVLRFWETEFPQLRPHKSGTGQRLYRKRDVELALRIKRLLYEDGYTIAGARQVFQSENRRPKPAQSALPGMAGRQMEARLDKVKSELRELLGLLSAPPSSKPQGNANVPSDQASGELGHRPRRLAPRRLAERDAPETSPDSPSLFDE